jgi:O-antigen ligase
LPDIAIFAVGLLVSLQIIILLQLIPMPGSTWSNLSGRQLPISALGLTPYANDMRPLSLDPEATRRFGTALFLPGAIVLGALGAAKRDLRLFLWALVAAGVLSSLVGALQLALGTPDWLSFYGGAVAGAASGVFANANHQAAFLCAALFALALLVRLEDGQLDLRPFGLKARVHAGWMLFPVFAIMIVATGSRSGTVVLPGVLVASAIIAVRMRSVLKIAVTVIFVALLVGLAILFYPSDNSLALRENFLFGQDIRYAYLPDIQFTLREYWPYGSGFGTFRHVFQHNETLDIATAGVLNHAHNDILEWLIEGGIAGAIWLSALILVLAYLFYHAVSRQQERGRPTHAHLATAGVLLVVTIGLMSLVDYPMRTRAVLAVSSLAFALVISAAKSPALYRPEVGSRRWVFPALALLGLVAGLQSLRIRAAQAAVWAGDGRTAATLRPQSGPALSLAAEVQLVSGNLPAARVLALRALNRSPVDASAVRTLAITAPARSADSAWRVAATMGWRDTPTQLWAMRQAFRNGEYDVAALRADALLRTGREAGRLFLGEVRSYAQNDGFRRQLLPRLVLEPSWRALFFRLPTDVPDGQLKGVILTLQDLASKAKPSSAESRAAISALIKRRRFEDAWNLYRLTAGALATSTGMLGDGGFKGSTDEYKRQSTPFDWTITNRPGVNASIEESGPRTLLISADGESRARVVSRYVVLPEGKYILSYQMRGDQGSAEGIAVIVSCGNGSNVLGRSNPASINTATFETRAFAFVLPEACPLAQIAFEAEPTGAPTMVEFDNLQIAKAI